MQRQSNFESYKLERKIEMKKFVHTLIIAMFVFLIIGCKKKTVDSSSDESLKNTVEAVKESLDAEKKKSFEDAIQAIAMSEIGNIFEARADSNGIQRRIKDRLDGKTADEIIAEGNRIIAERQKKEREQANIEIAETQKEFTELETKRKNAEQDKEELKKLRVLHSQFYFKDSFPVIELTVKNETAYAISKAYFEGVLATPGRSIPWVKDSFNYNIRGGLEPGEQATWKTVPWSSGDWRYAPSDRNDMVLTVTVVRIDSADEEAIFDAEFSKWDIERLQELNERLEELKKALGQ